MQDDIPYGYAKIRHFFDLVCQYKMSNGKALQRKRISKEIQPEQEAEKQYLNHSQPSKKKYGRKQSMKIRILVVLAE